MMQPVGITESVVEEATLQWLEELGYETIFGPEIDPESLARERESFDQVLLEGRLCRALENINPDIPGGAIDEAVRKLTRTESPNLFENNRRFHRMLTDGVPVEYRFEDRIKHDTVKLIDFDDASTNEWLAVNQYTVIENRHHRRPDIVIFINGIPLAVLELKNPGDENATVRGAFNQLQTYKNEIQGLFAFNEALVVSDGLEARMGTITADWEWFLPWRTIEGTEIAPKDSPQLETLVKGVFQKERFLDMLRYFIVFEVDGSRITKKMAGYHQFHAVNKAVECTVHACSLEGDKRAGVIWHTQGSGKSLSMAFYAGKIIQRPEMANPTLVVLTDRNDLDEQLFGTFSACQDLLRQKPVQAKSRSDLRKLLKVASGGVIFTTMQKFLPEEKGDTNPLLSERRNIIFIADEAHRSHYGFIDGLARHLRDALPNASFIGFTGTPIEQSDRSTPAVFGDYIDVYDIERAVEDGATVKIYYEGRLAKIELNPEERPKIDPEFEEVTEGEEIEKKEKLKTKWAKIEALVGTPKRVGLIARDLVNHFESRLEAIDGKGMIVCMSRRICVDLYNAIIKLRPEWHDEDDEKGYIKIVMTGSATDPVDWQLHIRNKERRKRLARRFKDPDDPMKLVIVRDMWLTGFDAPSLHTMYVDKPMRGHTLMQAIARVNRVFRDKPGGLVVDYLGLADQLKKALSNYTEGDRGNAGIPQEEAVAIMLEKYEIIKAMFHGFDYSPFFTGAPKERLSVLPAAQEHILSQEENPEEARERYCKVVTELSKAFALAVPHEEALKIKDVVGFFQAVKSALIKTGEIGRRGPTEEELDTAVKQIVSKAISSDEIIDIFSAAGLKKPDISILSDEFLEEVRNMPHRNLAVETLKKLLREEIKSISRRNVVQGRSFAKMLEQAIIKYQNRSIETAQVIARLIDLAKEVRDAHKRGEKLGLTDEELAFYDALETNDSAVKVLGDKTLRKIALELVETVRRNATIDWTVKENVRAKLRTMVKRVLRKYGYPPDKQEKATLTVLEQAEALCLEVAA